MIYLRLPDVCEALSALPHVTAQPPGRGVALGGGEGRRVPGEVGGVGREGVYFLSVSL